MPGICLEPATAEIRSQESPRKRLRLEHEERLKRKKARRERSRQATPWTECEVELLKHGILQGLECTEIVRLYSIPRWVSATRSQKAKLMLRYPDLAKMPSIAEDKPPQSQS
ncbi:hypothetical protein LTR09_008673 [Extremus antarcticus]|uniref:Uncharacterized protein n=1 Tax=Extremus antarcticus TaxID=702011 RepID=A0AAJ0DA21_9PEZI|nr:hypothetical protein LTR09_008673 [Extremus antarcticus]